MRSVSDGATTTLVAAQWATTRRPYKKMVFASHDGLTTYDFSTDSAAYGDRILGIDHWEEYSESGGGAIITLNNYDSTVPDLKGYWVEIGHGLNTGTVAVPVYEYTLTARLWVKYQTNIWYRGNYIVILELEDFIARMKEIKIHLWDAGQKAPYYYFSNFDGAFGLGSMTIYHLIKTFINNETSGDSTSKFLSADITLENATMDSIIDVWKPPFVVNEVNGKYETLLQVVTRLLEYTACFPVIKPSNAILIVYPAGSTTPDITYYRDTSPQYTSFIEKTSLVTPNKVNVFANANDEGHEDEEGLWHPKYVYYAEQPEGEDPVKIFITGSYENTDETDKYEEVIEFVQKSDITEQAKADVAAEVIALHRQPTGAAGRVVVRHDCRVELYDRIAVVTNA